jgi:Ca-activated chloride channel family protein
VTPVQWLEPGGLWLAAWMFPAIFLLYLLKRKHEDRTVSSTLLWNRMLQRMEANRPWQKLRQNLLLWLQLAAALLMVLGLGRPATETDGLRAGHTVLVVDVSGSMLSREGDGTRLERAKQTVKRWIREAHADHKVTLVEAGRTPRILAAGCQGDDCLEALDRMQAGAGSADLDGALSLARAIADKESSAEVVLVGDGTGMADAKWLPHRFHRIGTQSANLSVGAFAVKRAEQRAEAFARIDNPGGRPLQGSVMLKNDRGRILDVRPVSLRPRESTVIRWDRLEPADWYQVRVSAAGDVLPQDDARWALPSGAEKITAWMAGRENLFLRKAVSLSEAVEPVEADRLPENPGDSALFVADGFSGTLPPRVPLLVFDPAASRGLVAVQGMKNVSGEAKVDENHPVTGGLKMGELHVAGAQVIRPPWAKPLVSVGGVPLVLAGEHQGRRVVLFAFDPAKSDLPLRPEFPVLIYRAVQWLVPGAQSGGIHAEAGSELDRPLGGAAGPVRFQGEDPVVTGVVSGGGSGVRLPERPGIYRMSDARTGAFLGRVAVHFPEEESAVGPGSIPTMQADFGNRQAAGQREWWRWLALAGLLLAGAEWVVFSRGHTV